MLYAQKEKTENMKYQMFSHKNQPQIPVVFHFFIFYFLCFTCVFNYILFLSKNREHLLASIF